MAVETHSRSRLVMLALGGAALLILTIVVGIRGNRGHSAGTDRDRAKAPDNRDARRNGAQAALKEGRFEAAFAAFAGPGDGELGADDLYALGTALLARDRLVLGWTALEAARRVEPGHAAAARAVDELEGKLIVAVGRDQMSRRGAADEVEYLRSVRGGPALGLLVLGLARYAGDAGWEREFLDRLLIRNRSVLRAVETPADAVKLVARLLMETGRAGEASDLVRPMAAGAVVDPEAAWLLSRVALQLGQDETADAMLARAGGFGRDGSSSEPAPFVGSRKCAECHPSAYRAAQQASPHARTLYLGEGLRDIPLPDRPVPDPLDPHILHRFTRTAADRIGLETRDDRGRVARAVVAYAFGSGEHGMTMVSRDDPSGTPRELRISYYTADRSWRGTKGVNALPHDAEDFIGLEMSERSLRHCLHCHTTWFRTALPDPSRPTGPEAGDRGIGCERCHGPGLNHVKAVETGYAEAAIGVTRHSPPRRLLQSCEDCHASNGSVEPSDPEFTRVQGTTLKFSRCFTRSQGAIHCAACHDPHRGLDTRTSHYEATGLGCHSAPAAAGPGRAHPPACPINPASGCIACHMPKVQDTSFQTRFTDHHIRVHRQPAGQGRAARESGIGDRGSRTAGLLSSRTPQRAAGERSPIPAANEVSAPRHP
jgi:hypothetical protein